jgi:hypothetical protein
MCGDPNISVHWESERVATAACRACGRVIRIEFDPPDEPTVKGRIDIVFDPQDASGSDPEH